MPIEISVFSDAVTALVDLVKAVSSLKDLPARERERYRSLLHDTFTLLDSAILLVLNKITDVELLAERNRADFAHGLRSLDHQPEWERMARDVRLCHPLRAASAELNGVVQSLTGRLTLKDPAAVRELIDEVLDREYQLASFISRALTDLAKAGADLEEREADLERAKELLGKFKTALRDEREALIRAEIESFAAI
jgi:hypothetical protein